jgi:hypothetical protein
MDKKQQKIKTRTKANEPKKGHNKNNNNNNKGNDINQIFWDV